MKNHRMDNSLTKVLNLSLKYFLSLLLLLFLSANLFTSQIVSPLYFQLVREDRFAVASFLNKIKNISTFTSFFTINKNIFGDSLEQDIFASDLQRKAKISYYESLLSKNAKARDLFYNLYLLYQQDGNEEKAQYYLQQARTIDPSI